VADNGAAQPHTETPSGLVVDNAMELSPTELEGLGLQRSSTRGGYRGGGKKDRANRHRADGNRRTRE
jgi:hypothetical protein